MAAYQTFSQREHLTTRLRNILHENPPGLGPIFEFLQNADDAGAASFCVMVDAADARSEAPTSLLFPGLAPWRGPSLVVYNSATFSDQDFDNITRLGNSEKIQDGSTIGRYGIGLNTCYMFTDVPQFMSRDQFIVFDPHERALPDQRPGVRMNFLEQRLAETFPDETIPFEIAALPAFHCSMRAYFKGTVFRLPLRSAQQAADSQIAKHAFTTAQLRDLLLQFTQMASETLVFLKSVERICCLERAADGTVSVLGRTGLAHVTPELRAQRALMRSWGAANPFARLTAAHAELGPEAWAAGLGFSSLPRATYLLEVHEERIGGSGAVFGEESKGEALAPGTEVRRWLVVSGTGVGPGDLCMSLKMLQFGGVALPLGLNAGRPDGARPSGGRAFCFLPLAMPTGLPVLVNGVFALTGNRRDLWRSDAESERMGAASARGQWNDSLLHSLLPALYLEALQTLVDIESSRGGAMAADAVRSLWPQPQIAAPPFDELAAATLRLVAAQQARVFYAPFLDSWHGLNDVLFADAAALATGPTMLALLSRCEAAVVPWDDAVAESLTAAAIDYRVTTPEAVTDIVRRRSGPTRPRGNAPAPSSCTALTPAEAEAVVEYAASRADDPDPSEWSVAQAMRVCRLLHGLWVLPLRSGAVGQLLCDPAAFVEKPKARAKRAPAAGGWGGKANTKKKVKASRGRRGRMVWRGDGSGDGDGDWDGADGGGGAAAAGAAAAGDDDVAPPSYNEAVTPAEAEQVALQAEYASPLPALDSGRAVVATWVRYCVSAEERFDVLAAGHGEAIPHTGSLAFETIVRGCRAGLVNVAMLTPAVVADGLGGLLPASWRGRAVVFCGPAVVESQIAACEWNLAAEAAAVGAGVAGAGATAAAAPAADAVPPAAADAAESLRLLWLLWELIESAQLWTDDVLLRFADWPIVPMTSGLVTTVKRAAVRQAVFASDHSDQCRAMLQQFGALFVDLPAGRRLRAALPSGRDTYYPALAASFSESESRDALRIGTAVRAALRSQVITQLRAGDASAAASAAAGALDEAREVAGPRLVTAALVRLPIFQTLDGGLQSLQDGAPGLGCAPPAGSGTGNVDAESVFDSVVAGIPALAPLVLDYGSADSWRLVSHCNVRRPTIERFVLSVAQVLGIESPPPPALWNLVLETVGAARVRFLNPGQDPALRGALQILSEMPLAMDGKRKRTPSDFVDVSDADVARVFASGVPLLPEAYFDPSPAARAGLLIAGLGTLRSCAVFARGARSVAADRRVESGLALVEWLSRNAAAVGWTPHEWSDVNAIAFIPALDLRGTTDVPETVAAATSDSVRRLALIALRGSSGGHQSGGAGNGGRVSKADAAAGLSGNRKRRSKGGGGSNRRNNNAGAAASGRSVAAALVSFEDEPDSDDGEEVSPYAANYATLQDTAADLMAARGPARAPPRSAYVWLRPGERFALAPLGLQLWSQMPVVACSGMGAVPAFFDSVAATGTFGPLLALAHLEAVVRPWAAAASSASPTTLDVWRGIVLSCLATINRAFEEQASNTIDYARRLARLPFVITDGGELVPASSIHVELDSDVAENARATPGFLLPLVGLLKVVGSTATGFDGVQPVVRVRGRAMGSDALVAAVRGAFNDPRLADFVVSFECDPSARLYVHRLVLASTCQHFAAMFDAGMAEQVEGRGRMLLPDWVSVTAGEALFRYLYTGELRVGSQLPDAWPLTSAFAAIALQLLQLADLYSIAHLTETMEVYLAQEGIRDVHNLCLLFEAARNTHARQLGALALFELRRSIAAVTHLPEFAALDEGLRDEVLGRKL